ncbi:lipase [Enterococcus sp. JM4C]|uniref:SGNH/GDSL hydrolase family protein n=1 Tax=Candidatus Enterococcus huntleyi TaxID=1857217 RepID=UPI0013798658|nr:SGNH/GDSL hydrolase family protein [Enterococcus sp. JM4C]KAF1298071.1 lipase [Enterococcus sp. JM4C]
MDKRIKKIGWPLLAIGFVALISYTGLAMTIPKSEPLLIASQGRATVTSTKKEKIHYTAVGDSLTQGVGDQTQQGGFVPLVADQLKEEYKLTSVEIDNFGVGGERSDQILKRLKKDDELRENIESSSIVSVTVGGNDLMKVIQSNIFGLSVKTFDKPSVKYQERVTEILAEIRELNPQVPIYVLGIYNPFYLNFPEITDMQTIVDQWNEKTQAAVEEEGNSYFIPINDLLYRGYNNEVGIETSDSNTSITAEDNLNTVKNNVLYEDDHFHPNNLGYQLMANAVTEQLAKTESKWLEKEAE